MGKASRKKNQGDFKVATVQNPDQGRSWFLPIVILIVLLGAVGVGILAAQRESNTGVRPEALIDHWHTAYGVYNCDSFAPIMTDQTDPEGIHTHTDGVIHVHPFRGTASGENATLGAFLRATGAVLTDSTYTPGPAESGSVLDESVGCNGEPATLQIAYWDNAIQAEQGDEPTMIAVDDLNDFRFLGDISALTLALVPEGTTIPAPPTIPNLSTLTDLG